MIQSLKTTNYLLLPLLLTLKIDFGLKKEKKMHLNRPYSGCCWLVSLCLNDNGDLPEEGSVEDSPMCSSTAAGGPPDCRGSHPEPAIHTNPGVGPETAAAAQIQTGENHCRDHRGRYHVVQRGSFWGHLAHC